MLWIVALMAALLSGCSVMIALRLRGRMASLENRLALGEQGRSAHLGEMRATLAHHGRLLLRVSEGKPVSPGQALDGRAFDEIEGEAAWRLLETSRGVRLLDVRDAHEYSAGHIPGALWIPLIQLEQRWEEAPREADYLIIHCASGSRSAAACEYLSSVHGYLNLYNLTGGLSSWPGPVETGGRK